jgi:Glutathione S-transferase, N-terminal domain
MDDPCASLSTMTPPCLLHFRVSHYNEKVRWALDHKRWPHVRRALVPGLHVPRVRLLTWQNKAPADPVVRSPRSVEKEALRDDPKVAH